MLEITILVNADSEVDWQVENLRRAIDNSEADIESVKVVQV